MYFRILQFLKDFFSVPEQFEVVHFLTLHLYMLECVSPKRTLFSL
jgi:hypothetical protein